MTQKETERLTRMEEKVENIKDDVVDIKSDIKAILTKLENQEQKFITRLEGKVAVGVVTTMITVLAFWFSHFGKVN